MAAQTGSQLNLDIPGPDKYREFDLSSGSENQPRSPDDASDDPTRPLMGDGASDPKSPVDRVRFILAPGESVSEGDEIGEHALFCQMDVLLHFEDGELGWKEMARWLKYEEKVEAGDRWSKPHVSTTSLRAVFEIRKAIADGAAVVDLDMNSSHSCVHQVAESLVDTLRREKNLSEDQLEKVLEVLTKPHKHKHRKADKAKLEAAKVQVVDENGKPAGNSSTKSTVIDHNSNEGEKKKKKWVKKDDLNEMSQKNYQYPGGITPNELKAYKPNKHLLTKIPKGSEVANILVGQVDFLDEPIMAFIRLRNGSNLGELSEVALPTRFVFVLLAPLDGTPSSEHEEVGRAMASTFGDKVFCEVAYRAQTRQDLIDGFDEYIDDLTVLPPSIWDPTTRLEPPEKTLNMDKIRKRVSSERRAGEKAGFNIHDAVSGDDSLQKTGRPFGGMLNDMKRRYRLYLSDIKDGFAVQTIASIVFLYFACITPIVTFGGLMGTATDGMMGTMETILSGAICGITFALFSGQPLTIVGATGPLLIFESIMYVFCKDYEIHFLSFRFWTGVWITAILMVMVVFDLSYLVKYITRFTEESFSVLISIIFIAEAFKKVFSVASKKPIETDTLYRDPGYLCHCVPGNASVEDSAYNNTILKGYADPNATDSIEAFTSYFNWTTEVGEDCINYQKKVIVNHECISEDDCEKYGWQLVGDACHDYNITHSVPDVFFLSLVLFLLTFSIAYSLRLFRTSRCFPSIVRNTVADFGVLISILVACGIDYAMGMATPKLRVPSEFKTTVDGRGWVVNPMDLLPQWYLIILSLLPAVLATILIFLDQQITAVIINRKEHKLKKPPGFHLDLFVLAILIFVCSLLGLPWFVAATVRSITHVKSLIMQSEIKVPGEKPFMLGVREQRVTAFFIHVLIGVSVLMTSILQYIPMPVLYGVFLYMGVTSLGGVQFVDRISILLMPAKYQPDLVFLRHVPLKRVHIFTLIQIALMVGMWVVKSIKAVAIAFPLMILALCFVRKGMDYFFTQTELFWLDHILPEEDRRKKEDDLEEHAEGYDSDTEPLTSWPDDEKKGAKGEKRPAKKSEAKSNNKEQRPKV